MFRGCLRAETVLTHLNLKLWGVFVCLFVFISEETCLPRVYQLSRVTDMPRNNHKTSVVALGGPAALPTLTGLTEVWLAVTPPCR